MQPNYMDYTGINLRWKVYSFLHDYHGSFDAISAQIEQSYQAGMPGTHYYF